MLKHYYHHQCNKRNQHVRVFYTQLHNLRINLAHIPGDINFKDLHSITLNPQILDQTEKKLSVVVVVENEWVEEEERMFCKHIHFLPIKYSCKYYAKLNWKWGKIKTIFCGFIQTLFLFSKTMRINFWINSKVHNQTIITKVEIKKFCALIS